jgi:hypothetical protein
MAAYTATATHIPAGINRGNYRHVKVVVPTAMVNTDTLTVAAPAGTDWTLVPFAIKTYTLSGTTYTCLADTVAVTTHDISTGITVLTASGAGAAQFAKIVIEYGAID